MNIYTSGKVVSESGSLPWPVSKLLCLLHEDLTFCFLAVARIERSFVTTSQSMGRQEELRISDVQLQTYWLQYNLHRDERGLFVSFCFHPPFSIGGCARLVLFPHGFIRIANTTVLFSVAISWEMGINMHGHWQLCFRHWKGINTNPMAKAHLVIWCLS